MDSNSGAKQLTDDDKATILRQNSRLVTPFMANKLEKDAKKHWDLFYKRNENRFFKDRHWTTREFQELLGQEESSGTLLEIGCGVGNLLYPLIQDGLPYYFYACDLSPRAVELVKAHELYSEDRINACQIDVTEDGSLTTWLSPSSIDLVTMVFVLSAIHPSKFETSLKNVHSVLKNGGVVLFRDYGLYDMAQLRFKPGHKISDNFYMRQDGTRSYFFSVEELSHLFTSAGFEVVSNTYVHRRTINKKEGIDVPRIFVQGKFKKIS